MSLLKGKKLAVLGAGRLGETLIRGLLAADAVDAGHVTVTAGHAERVRALEQRHKVRGAASNAEAARAADIVLLAVKPQTVPVVLGEIAPVLNRDQLLISVAASVSLALLQKPLAPDVPVIRAMPNTPALIEKGMTGLAPGSHASPAHVALAERIFGAVGRTRVLDEKHMDAVTGLSACGPAFIYIVIESLAEAGVKVGLPRDVATELAAQTVLGAGAMVLETGEHPARLKDLVTTPAGCTIDGILELEEGGLRVTLIKAVVRSTERARELLEG
ncbi:MAG TPA: pyrroline-5-carboxylate reductase [Candidatus Eisenbacteria bacterium]|nr:pyrroline-5-carboxylate reductase [Candidatus Eisenbacteria bacterium]